MDSLTCTECKVVLTIPFGWTKVRCICSQLWRLSGTLWVKAAG